jgi:hypothetical protein
MLFERVPQMTKRFTLGTLSSRLGPMIGAIGGIRLIRSHGSLRAGTASQVRRPVYGDHFRQIRMLPQLLVIWPNWAGTVARV